MPKYAFKQVTAIKIWLCKALLSKQP